MMSAFFAIYDLNDITMETWKRLSIRLQQDVKSSREKIPKRRRYKVNEMIFLHLEKDEFSGIINYFRNKTKGKIENEICFTSSSVNSGASNHEPINVSLFEDQNKNFCSKNEKNSWLCFNFKNHGIVPTHYTIRSRNGIPNWYHPKSWVIECSNNNLNWEILDEQTDCSILNGKRIVHTFDLKNPDKKEFRFLRMRATGPNWCGDNYLTIETFEIYGKLI